MSETSEAIHDLTKLIGHYHIQEVKLSTERCDYYLKHLLALVAERDELRAKCKIQHGVINDMIEKQRNDDRDRDLRKDLICAALTGIVANKGLAGGYGEADTMIDDAMWLAGKTIAAMRKGEA